MKDKLIELGFIEWLNMLEIAPYPLLFWDTPKIIQTSFIKKYLRDIYFTELIIEREDDYWYVKILEFKSGNKYNKILHEFNVYDDALGYGISHVVENLTK